MVKKRKISIRKILQMLLTLAVTSCCIVAVISASRIEDTKMLKSVAIHYNNCKKYHSVEEKDIMDLAINSRQIDIAHTPISRLDIHRMEQLIREDPWIANAQAFVDNERVLQMYITQRIPVVRVFGRDGRSFYLDSTMSIMPLSASYIYYTTVFTNLPDLKNDSVSWSLRKDIISLSKAIQADSFWSAQISQVIVDSPGMYELAPILGDHRILFGGVNDMKEKFSKLFVFYKNVLNEIGWDRYQILDIRFKGQVIASPSLPYSGPVDKAITNMNWINSIVETEAGNDTKDSVRNKEAGVNSVPDAKKKPTAKPVAKASSHNPIVNAVAKKHVNPSFKKIKNKQIDKNKNQAIFLKNHVDKKSK